MADQFQLYKDAQKAKDAARKARKAADDAKKKREEAWDLYTDQYNAYMKYKDLRPEDREKWVEWVNQFRKDYNAANDAWWKLEQAANAAEQAAINAVNAFNQTLPPDAPLMPMDF